MRYKAFSPGSVTLFFEIVENKKTELMGSRGVGVCVSRGVETEVEEGEKLKIIVNGKIVRGKIQEYIAKKYNFTGTIRSDIQLPISQGFGMSGAIALSTSLALAKWRSVSYLQAAKIAHEAEIAMRTGLGDVATQFEGGFTIRLKPGIQPYGVVDRLPFGEKIKLVIFGDKLETRSILEDKSRAMKIKKLGHQAMEEFLKRKTVEEGIKIARKFAFQLNLMGDALRKFLEKCENATQSMIGNSAIIFGDCNVDLEKYEIYEVLPGDRAKVIWEKF